MPKSKIQFILLAVLSIFISCTFTTTKTENPEFVDDINLVGKKLDSIISCTNFNFNGRKVTKNKKTTSEIEISVTNCQDVPVDENNMKALAKIIATEIKQNLKDANQYDIYQVLFVTKTESGGIIKRNWVGQVFNSAEL